MSRCGNGKKEVEIKAKIFFRKPILSLFLGHRESFCLRGSFSLETEKKGRRREKSKSRSNFTL